MALPFVTQAELSRDPYLRGAPVVNDPFLQYQYDEAYRQEIREREKQNRLQSGRDRISAIFDEQGGTWSTPSEWVSTPQEILTEGKWKRVPRMDGEGDRWERNTAPVTQMRDIFSWSAPEERTEAGLGTGYYDNFRNSIVDFYQPEVDRQFTDAKGQNLFDLARRGLTRSSAAVTRAEDLTREKAMQDAQIQQNAEQQTAQLRSDMNRAKQNALNLLQNTEDVTTASNTALSEVNAIQSKGPDFSELGDVFGTLLNSAASYNQSQKNRQIYEGLKARSANESAGRQYG